MDLDAPAEYQDLETADAAYHSISALAVVALVLGLLSPLAFVHPLLWALPITGIALAWAAIARIDRSEGALIGRKAAILGLAVALLCGLGAVTKATTRPLWLAYRAERVAERFLELLRQGKTYEAHQLWTRPQFRLLPGSDYQALYAENPAAAKDYEEFLKREVTSDLVALGEQAEVVHQRTALTASDSDRDYLMVYYRMSGPTKAGPIDKEIRFTIERLEDEQSGEHWRVLADDLVVE
ncbi:MAG: DUF4190 domain-containing protein [Pirellulales bacterium]